jgi:hypothetical protein
MKKATVLVSMAAVVALLVAGVAGVFGTGDAPSVYASRLAGIQGAGISGIQIQNLDASQTATIVSDFYNQRGGGPVTITRPDVAAGAAANIFLPSETALQNGAYAAIISANRQIAAIARTDWTSSGGAAIYSNVQPGNDVSLPLAAKSYNGQTSLVSVQNTDTSQQANVSVQFFQVGNPTPLVDTNISIGPGTSQTIDLGKDATFASVPDGALGSMKFASSIPVGVQSFMDIETSDKAVYAFEGVPSEQAAGTLYVPLFRNNFFGTTGISVVNPGTTDVQVELTYYASTLATGCTGSTVHNGGSVTVAAGASSVFYQGNVSIPGTGASMLNDNCFGSAVIAATGGNILAVVNDANLAAGTSAAYNAVSLDGGATKVALPLFRKQHVGLTTGIQAMNIGSGRADVTIDFSDATGAALSGCGAECTQSIDSNGSYTWFPNAAPAWSFINAGTYGSATINSNEPLAVIVNDASLDGSVDSAIYNGIKAD